MAVRETCVHMHKHSPAQLAPDNCAHTCYAMLASSDAKGSCAHDSMHAVVGHTRKSRTHAMQTCPRVHTNPHKPHAHAELGGVCTRLTPCRWG